MSVLRKNRRKLLHMADSVQTPSISKRVRLSNEKQEKGQEDIDRISDLPDSVLCHILSFLPTKMSVATSILSKRWIDIWTTVPIISFSSTEYSGELVDPVYNVLAKFRARTIHQFSLDLYPFQTVDDEHLDAWISAVVKCNPQELKLKSSSFQNFKLPDHVFACKTLVCLKLFHNVFVDVPAKVCLQSLRILQLEQVLYSNDGSLNKLLSSCPILEDLIVERACGDNIIAMDINVPSLKRINVKRARSGADTCKLRINAPLLERIELSDIMISNIQVEDLSNLVEAIIHVHIYYEDIVMLIQEMGNIKLFLSLSECAVRSICFHRQLPVFCNLVYLDITSSCEYWHNLVPLLKCSDNLKVLVFHIKVHHAGRNCDKPLPGAVLKCVPVSLETIKLTGFCDKECNWNLVRYFLKNAEFLKQMKIGTSLRMKKRCRRCLENLLKYPKASMACEIGFFIDHTGREFHL